MNTIDQMLRRHPHADLQHTKDYGEALDAMTTCAEACTSCADACLDETARIEQLRRCISTNLDCADVCTAAARVLTRQTEPPNGLVQAQLHACVLACQVCADECERFASALEYCRICALVCRRCQERCNFLLGEISSSGLADDSSNPAESPSYTP